MSEIQHQRTAEERHVLTMVRWLLYLVFVVIAFLILDRLGPILTPLLAAAGVAYLLDGAVDRMEARGLPRTGVVAALLVGFMAVVIGLLVVVVPLISEEIARFAAALPALVERASAWLAADYGIEVPRDWQAYLKGEEFRSFLESAVGPASRAAAVALGGVFGFLGWLAELLLVPVFAFYFLVDWDHIVARVHAFVPPRHRRPVADIARDIDRAVSAWVRGQFMVMAILAALYATAFKIIGLHLGITVGVVVGLLTVIPFLGTLVGAVLAGLMLVLDWQGPEQLLAVGAVFLVLHVAEGAVLTPRLVGKRVGLGEVGALFAVLAGGQLLGFTGVLLAVPIAASVAVLVRRALTYYETTAFFTAGAELATAPAVAAPAPPPLRTAAVEVPRPVLDPLESKPVAAEPPPAAESDPAPTPAPQPSPRSPSRSGSESAEGEEPTPAAPREARPEDKKEEP